MADLSKEEQFLLKEYESAQKATYHADEMKSKVTQFFLIFTGFATAALTLLVKGEAQSTVFNKPEGALAMLILIAAALGSTFILIIARLRRSQIEHFRIINNIRSYFLKKEYNLWNIVELSAKTLPKPNRFSGSYFWCLLINLSTSYLYLLSTYIHLTKVFKFQNYIVAFFICGFIFLFSVWIHDKLYFTAVKVSLPRNYSDENPPF